MVADIAYHGGHGENPHAHIMLTTRPLTPEGFGTKNLDWNKKERLASWRADWAARAETLDCDPEIHLGRSAWMALRAGEVNERTQRNDQIAEGNRDREQELAAGYEEIHTIQAQIQKLIRRDIEKVKETVKGLVRGTQPDPDTSTAAREAAAATARA